MSSRTRRMDRFSVFCIATACFAVTPRVSCGHDEAQHDPKILHFVVRAGDNRVTLTPATGHSSTTGGAHVTCSAVEIQLDSGTQYIVFNNARVDYENCWFAGDCIKVKKHGSQLRYSGTQKLNRKKPSNESNSRRRQASQPRPSRKPTLTEIDEGLIESAKEHKQIVEQILKRTSMFHQ